LPCGNADTSTVKVNAAKTGNSNTAYSLLHANPVIGKNYYRLKMVDNDGSYSYSSVRLVSFNKDVIVTVYPNPFLNRLNITVSGENNTHNTLRIFNYGGQQIMQKIFASVISLDVSKLAAGVYLVQIDNGERIQNFTMQKQK
jgi:hypothetical protein